LTVAFGNGFLGAFGFTRAAGNAVSDDFVGHEYFPFVLGLTLARIAQGQIEVNSDIGNI
jgi:hypothetical protein